MKSRSFNTAAQAIKFVETLAESVATIQDCDYIASDTKIHTVSMRNDYKDAIKWCGRYEAAIYLRTRGAEVSEKRIEELHDTKLLTIKIEIYKDESIVMWGNKAA